MRAPRTPASTPVYALLAAAVAMGALATPGFAQSDDVFERYGFELVERSTSTDGREQLIHRPQGRFGDGVQISMVVHPDGWNEVITLVMTRDLLADDTEASQELLGSFLRTVIDDSAAGHLAFLIESPDPEVRRGTKERRSSCCAIPPENPTYVKAVAVVDGLEGGAWVREDIATFRFENRDRSDGRPALAVTLSGPSSPEELLGVLFAAASSQDPAALPELCTFVREEGDEAMHDICALSPGADGWNSFVEQFGTGEVTGPARIEDDRAQVPFRFGPDGERQGLMTLVRWSDVWYLIRYGAAQVG